MKLLLIIATMMFLGASTGFAQTTCSCEKSPNSTCHGRVTCPDGCSALCGSGDTCYLSCRKGILTARVTAKFVKKEGQDIAAVLASLTRQRIQFTPHPRNEGKRYDLDIKNDDLWNVCDFLNKRGTVKINGTDFSKLKELRKEMREGKRISVNFVDIPARDAIAKLAFMSGVPFRLKSGDPEKLVSISLQEVTLNEIVDRISMIAGVKIGK